MKRTPFTPLHESLGAKIIEFGGYAMPVQYAEGIVREHLAVRERVGVFDVSHMGEFEVSGPAALAFLQKMTTNDVAKLSEGNAQYSAMCYDDGGIVDDLLVYHLGDRYMLVVNAANLQKDFAWLESHLEKDVRLTDVSDRTALLAVQGPKSLEVLSKLTKANLAEIRYYHFIRATLAGIPMTISRTGYTGEPGFELYLQASEEEARSVWTALFEAGAPAGIAPVGLGARDTLRLEMGFCLYGNDIDKTTHPLEAGLGWISKFEKGDFIGSSALKAAKAGGLRRKLVGFVLEEKAVPRHGYALQADGRNVGTVTSGTFSPSLQQGIGMGYVEAGLAAEGQALQVDVRGRTVKATTVKLPFLKK